jgi:hypothetical protein
MSSQGACWCSSCQAARAAGREPVTTGVGETVTVPQHGDPPAAYVPPRDDAVTKFILEQRERDAKLPNPLNPGGE